MRKFRKLSKPTTPAGGMYLANLTLKRFRSCRAVRVKFQPGLTLIVGENNSGKSNVINGIRLLTSPLSGRRNIVVRTRRCVIR